MPQVGDLGHNENGMSLKYFRDRKWCELMDKMAGGIQKSRSLKSVGYATNPEVTLTPNQNFGLILGGRAAGPSTMRTAHNARFWEKSLGFSFWIAEAEMDKLKH